MRFSDLHISHLPFPCLSSTIIKKLQVSNFKDVGLQVDNHILSALLSWKPWRPNTVKLESKYKYC